MFALSFSCKEEPFVYPIYHFHSNKFVPFRYAYLQASEYIYMRKFSQSKTRDCVETRRKSFWKYLFFLLATECSNYGNKNYEKDIALC